MVRRAGKRANLDFEGTKKAPGRPEFAALEGRVAALVAGVTPVHRHSFLRYRRGISYNTPNES